MVLREGVEPPTLGSSDQRSTTELPKQLLKLALSTDVRLVGPTALVFNTAHTLNMLGLCSHYMPRLLKTIRRLYAATN